MHLLLLIAFPLFHFLAIAAPVISRQGAFEIFPVEGGTGILNTKVGPSEAGIYTEVMGKPITSLEEGEGKELVVKAVERARNTR